MGSHYVEWLEKEVVRLTKLLEYANHLTGCGWRYGHDCDCGLEEIRAKMAKKDE